MTIGERIRSARKESGLTQAQLAKLCGVATITIRQYESNKRQPKLDQLARIAQAMGLYASDIIGDEWDSVDMKGSFGDASNEPMRARLIAVFDRLNDDGQEIAVQRVEELTEIPRYKKNATE